MQHCQFFHKSKIKKGKFTHLGGSSVKICGVLLVKEYNSYKYSYKWTKIGANIEMCLENIQRYV